jgi:hypothetical protein
MRAAFGAFHFKLVCNFEIHCNFDDEDKGKIVKFKIMSLSLLFLRSLAEK